MTQNAISKELNFKLSWENMLSDSLPLATIRFLNFMSLHILRISSAPTPSSTEYLLVPLLYIMYF